MSRVGRRSESREGKDLPVASCQESKTKEARVQSPLGALSSRSGRDLTGLFPGNWQPMTWSAVSSRALRERAYYMRGEKNVS